ncbi:periplasmic serine protease, Do/DeqQ family [Rubellimicrobium thermophilum DSM 16684]|uniref:Probable periplasmic serine endoprotease DegP-like n=1 Tax=Rubellimicrobium thermophilum DSM 16684 TaxID=1123069 RepID=S9R3L4_9RHOB|nr:DegQ family serine endoprotease [Rubellimicrobium thermophilum]EPX86502.1 periplasmic serine protease, Do/DeqQ family [Rubellimicrobium thermophilum DSM 16684]
MTSQISPTVAARRPAAAAALLIGTALAVGAVVPLTAQESSGTAVTPEAPLTSHEDGRPASFAELAEQVSPAVVNITTTTLVAGGIGPMPPLPEGFEDFFENFRNNDGTPRRSSALGSGFVISPDGYIVTNNHVIEGADEIRVEFYSGETMDAEIVGTDPNTDIALLKVDGTDLPHVEFGDSDGPDAEVGDWVLAMGNPLGQGFSVSAGIISARNRALSGTYDDYIQTDAAINQGNSGGPLFNMRGEVIGVNTAILSPNGGSIGIGFAMSSAVVKDVVAQLKEYGETRRGWLGVRIQDLTPDMVDAIEGLASAHGALVTDVPEGPAAEAGIRSGDVILTFEGNQIDDTRELVRLVGAAPVGETVTLEVLRDGQVMPIEVTLGRREEAEASILPASTQNGAPRSSEMLGLSLSEPAPELLQKFGLDENTEGLVVTAVDPESNAADKGLQPGDVIAEASQTPVRTVAELKEVIDAAREAGRKSVLLLIRRAGEPRFVALPIDEAG